MDKHVLKGQIPSRNLEITSGHNLLYVPDSVRLSFVEGDEHKTVRLSRQQTEELIGMLVYFKSKIHVNESLF